MDQTSILDQNLRGVSLSKATIDGRTDGPSGNEELLAITRYVRTYMGIHGSNREGGFLLGRD